MNSISRYYISQETINWGLISSFMGEMVQFLISLICDLQMGRVQYGWQYCQRRKRCRLPKIRLLCACVCIHIWVHVCGSAVGPEGRFHVPLFLSASDGVALESRSSRDIQPLSLQWPLCEGQGTGLCSALSSPTSSWEQISFLFVSLYRSPPCIL